MCPTCPSQCPGDEGKDCRVECETRGLLYDHTSLDSVGCLMCQCACRNLSSLCPIGGCEVYDVTYGVVGGMTCATNCTCGIVNNCSAPDCSSCNAVLGYSLVYNQTKQCNDCVCNECSVPDCSRHCLYGYTYKDSGLGDGCLSCNCSCAPLPQCELLCPYGFTIGTTEKGCSICSCTPAPPCYPDDATICNATCQYGGVLKNNMYGCPKCFCFDCEKPPLSLCEQLCPYGYKNYTMLGSDGSRCPSCKCLTCNQSISQEVCDSQCEFGGVMSHSGECEICTCNGCDGKKYVTPACEIPICYGVPADNVTVCSNGRGLCGQPNVCVCNSSQYVGDECEIAVCFGIPSTNSSSCHNNGNCSDYNTCSCKDGYYGEDCSVWSCHGEPYTSHNACTNGNCTNLNQCSCEQGWSGDRCEIPHCFGKIGNTTCSKQGRCISPDYCECKVNYFGRECEHTNCFGIPSNNESVCSSHGKCIDHDNCTCESGYSGEDCSIWSCYGISYTASNVCSNQNGKCTETDKCECEIGWSGTMCENPICFNYSSIDPLVCGSKGTCIQPNNCSCVESYFGNNCNMLFIPTSDISIQFNQSQVSINSTSVESQVTVNQSKMSFYQFKTIQYSIELTQEDKQFFTIVNSRLGTFQFSTPVPVPSKEGSVTAFVSLHHEGIAISGRVSSVNILKVSADLSIVGEVRDANEVNLAAAIAVPVVLVTVAIGSTAIIVAIVVFLLKKKSAATAVMSV